MSEDVVFKGSRMGLQLVLNKKAALDHILELLDTKLKSAVHFFGEGTTVHLSEGQVPHESETAIRSLFERYGLVLNVTAAVDESPQVAAMPPKMPEMETPGEQTLVVRQTVRGGQEVVSRGSIVICGNVNPGASIVAGGDIDIRGTCRGLVHAGAYGDRKARVVADRMLAVQIRIADLVARAPDEMEKTEGPECAMIRDGSIVIEPINRQEVS